MIRDSLAFDIEWFFEAEMTNEERREIFSIIKTNIRREFKGLMPKRYWIFPTVPELYLMSNTLCVEFPSFGSRKYRVKLSELYRFLQKYFIVDKILFDGKTTYQIRGVNNDFESRQRGVL